MNLKTRRRDLQSVNGAVGLVVGLRGILGIYSPVLAVFLMFVIWIVGATVINLLTDPPDSH